MTFNKNRTPRVRHGGPEGYGASDPRGTICKANVSWHKKSLREVSYESPKNLANTNEELCQGDVLGFDFFLKEQAGAFAKFGGRFAGEVLAGFA